MGDHPRLPSILKPWPLASVLRRLVRLTPAKAALVAAGLAALGLLAVLLWPAGDADQPAAVAQPSASPTARPTPKATATRQPTPPPKLPSSRSLTFQPNESGRYYRGIYERAPDGLINLLVENP